MMIRHKGSLFVTRGADRFIHSFSRLIDGNSNFRQYSNNRREHYMTDIFKKQLNLQ